MDHIHAIDSVNPEKVLSNEVDLLVVDDDKHSLASVCRIFKSYFAHVIPCIQTDEGLTVIETKLVPYSMVISDHHNPLSPYNGAHLASLSAPVRQAKHIPFYLMSGGLHGAKAEEDLATIRAMIEQQIITGFLEKPYVFGELRKTILGHYKAKP